MQIDFQESGHSSHLGFLIGMIFTFFFICPDALELLGLSVQEKKQKIDFQDGRHGCHLGFPIRRILAISHPDDSYPVSSQLGFRFRRRSEKQIFKMATILDFRSEWF